MRRLKKWKGASTNRRIFSGVLIVAVVTLMVKIISAAKEIVVADSFGTGEVLDAFLFAYLLPAFAINVLAGSFSAAMMPTCIRTRDKKGKEAADKLFSSLMFVGVLFLLVSVGVLAVVGPMLLLLLGSGFNEQTMVLTHSLFYWLLPIVALTGSGHLFSSAINSGERFIVVALAPAITPIITVFALVLFVEQWGVFKSYFF